MTEPLWLEQTMDETDLPEATPEQVQSADVGDRFVVGVDGGDDHIVELEDPPGRIGRVFYCERCDRRFYSITNFERRSCRPPSDW